MDSGLQGVGAVQEDKEPQQVARHTEAIRTELAAAECGVQHRDDAQLLRAAGARHGVDREHAAAALVQPAVPLEQRVRRALGPHQEPARQLPKRHTRTDRGALHTRQQRPLSRPVSCLEGLGVDKHQAPRYTARLQSDVYRILSVAAQPAARIRLGERRRQLQLDLFLEQGNRRRGW